MATTTCTRTVGVFNTKEQAERAIDDLRRAGYRDDQIGMIAKDASGRTVHTDGSGTESNAGEGAAIGAAAGAATAVAVGAGIMAGVIPVIGPVIAAGPIAVSLLNAAGGAAIGGIAGALIGWGIPEEDAKYYESEMRAGKYLVTVDCSERQDAWDSFSRHGGYNRTIPAQF
jgi:hypothetical protein